MTAPLRLALAQLDLVVGDIAGNEARLRDYLDRARRAGAQLVLFPELAVTGYPPEDLLLKRHFLQHARAALDPPPPPGPCCQSGPPANPPAPPWTGSRRTRGTSSP